MVSNATAAIAGGTIAPIAWGVAAMTVSAGCVALAGACAVTGTTAFALSVHARSRGQTNAGADQ